MVAIVPRGLFDQLYGFDLGSNGPPVEPAVVGNDLPFFIDSEYPVQQGANLRLPPPPADDVPETEEASEEPPIIIPDEGGNQDGGNDAFLDAIFGPEPVDVAGATNAIGRGNLGDAAVDIIGTTPGGGGIRGPGFFGYDQPVDQGPVSIGFSPDDTTVSPYDYAPAPVQVAPNPSAGLSLPSPGQGSGVVNDVAANPQATSYDQYSSVDPAYGEEGISYTSTDTYADDMAALNSQMQSDYNHATAEAIAMREIANAGVNQRALEQTLNNERANAILSELSSRSPESHKALALQALPEMEAQQAEAQNATASQAAAQQLAGGMASSGLAVGNAPVDAGNTASFAQPGLTPSLMSGPTTVDGASYTVPSTVSMTPSLVSGPTLATNPNNVGDFASRGLGIAQANTAAAEAEQAANRAEQERGNIGAEVARSRGFTGGMAPGLVDGVSATARSGFQQIADDLGGLGLGTPPSLTGPANSRQPGVGSFAMGLLGEHGAEALANPSMSLRDLQQIELNSPSFNPYSGTATTSLEDNIPSFETKGTGQRDIAAEIDALNDTTLLGGEYGRLGGAVPPEYDAQLDEGYGLRGDMQGIGLLDDEEDEEEVGGYSNNYGSGFSSPSGVNGVSLSNGSVGDVNLGSQVSASLGGFNAGDNSSFGGGSFGFGSFGSDASSAINGFGSGPSTFGGNSSSNAFGNDGGFDSFGGFDNSSGGPVGGDGGFGGFNDDTSGGFTGGNSNGGPVGSDGSFGGFNDDTGGGAITDAFGNDDNGFGGFT